MEEPDHPGLQAADQARQRRLAHQIIARFRQPSAGQFEGRIKTKGVEIVAILVAAGAMANIRARIMSAWLCVVLEGSRVSFMHDERRSDSPGPFSISRNNKTPPSEESRPPSKRACNSLPETGDKTGDMRWFYSWRAVGFPRSWIWSTHPKHYDISTG